MSRSARLYVAGLVVVALAAAGVLAVAAGGGTSDPVGLAVLSLVAMAAAAVPVRFVHDGEVQAFTLEGGVVVALLLSGFAGLAAVVLLVADLVAHAVRSRSFAKTTFNAARSAVETSMAAIVFLAVAPGAPQGPDLPSVGAVLLAVLAFEVTSFAMTTELFARLGQASRRDMFRGVRALWGVNVAGNVTYGILLAASLLVAPWIAVLTGLLVPVMYLGYRGYATAIAGERRARDLNSMSHVLIDLPASEGGVGEVLSRLVQIFGAERGALLVELGPTVVEWTVSGGVVASRTLDASPRSGVLAEAMVVPEGRVLAGGAGRDGDAVVAPIRRHGEPIGAVTISGRRGVEPWGAADADLLATIANELAVALDNVALLAQVEEERARLEAESTKLNDILTSATDGIVAVLADGTIEAWNPGMARITGVPADVAVGQPWHAVLRLKDASGADLAPTGDHVVAQVVRGATVDGALSLQVLRSDGVWRWLQCTASPVRDPDGGHRGVVAVARDVTSERELEELKGDFIATVSHELRTPLTPLKGFLSTLRNPRSDLADDQVASIHQAMGSQLTRLETLIADLLAVAELDHGHFDLRPEPVDVSTMVEDAVQVEAADEAPRCSVTVSPGVSAIADPVALVRILRSLVSNALKHTTGPVDVRLEARDGLVTITVSDEGPGIASWDQERVFNRFERLGNHLTRTQGPGLGLTIARALARRMGGDVTLSSDIGTGATFTLVLPQARPRPVRLQAVSQG